MLIEIHMIQNHSPSNLNRDDLGAPKTCVFGGVTRARISSQCLKRSIRRSVEFQKAMEKDGGVRTRRLASVLARIVDSKDFDLTPEKLTKFLATSEAANGPSLAKLEALASEALELGGVKAKGKKKDKSKPKGEGNESGDEGEDTEAMSKMLLFLSTATVAKMARELKDASNAKPLAEKFKGCIAEKPCVPDIALCGRMTEVTKNSVFSDLNFTVEAALSTAHAISTHEVINEVDYFTAADDIPGQDAGAGHVNEGMFNSACFYKHFAIDWKQLVKNLGGDTELAATTIKCFLEAAARANPSGKQHAFAAFNCPDGILVEIKTKSPTPISYANAFADPVPPKTARGLIGESIARLGQYANHLIEGYGINAERFWFSPKKRYALTWIDNEKKEHEREQSVVGTSNEFGDFGKFIGAIMDKVAKS
ncbi:MAG: type I-E CRISPR-associated protein Cas7/Cse4/CasC [Nitrospirae bacterium]|nr:type I-E CRISPR-associated protein Cas7/Cse4/CasC [Nitrospirota bacterium]